LLQFSWSLTIEKMKSKNVGESWSGEVVSLEVRKGEAFIY